MDLLQVIFSGQNIIVGTGAISAVGGVYLFLNSQFNKKADKEATQREFDLMNQKINLKADQSVVTNMAEQVNEIHIKLMK